MNKLDSAALAYAVLVGIALLLLALKGFTLVYYAGKMALSHVYEYLRRIFSKPADLGSLSPARLAASHVCQWGDALHEEGL
jgi:hypothetical protein